MYYRVDNRLHNFPTASFISNGDNRYCLYWSPDACGTFCFNAHTCRCHSVTVSPLLRLVSWLLSVFLCCCTIAKAVVSVRLLLHSQSACFSPDSSYSLCVCLSTLLTTFHAFFSRVFASLHSLLIHLALLVYLYH